MKRTILRTLLAAFAVAMLGTGCGDKSGKPQSAKARKAAAAANPLTIVLAYQGGTNRTDVEIHQRQEQIRAGRQTEIALERLGWLFVAKARETFDAGFYKLAEQCAFAMESGRDASSRNGANGDEGVAATRLAATLLRAHVLQNLHRFAESEAVARGLVNARGLACDFGVLGDALMEQGKLEEAIEAYQRMADLKPDSQAATRVAHIRWLKGDLAGAIEMMESAAGAVSTKDRETATWVFTRLATLKWQALGAPASLPACFNQTGTPARTPALPDFTEAERDCETALTLRPNYAPALLLRGKMLMEQKKLTEAIEALSLAEKQNPLPDYQWALADALDAAGRSAEARAVEARLLRPGASADPRSFALFLDTRGEQPTLALHLAREELATRADVFTHDAIAWAELANGNLPQAQRSIARALAEGTQDARLFFHAAVIASRAGQIDDAEKFFQKSSALAHLLLPSERKHLHTVAARLQQSRAVAATVNGGTFSAGGE